MSLNKQKFVADVMLGRTARWLRLFGCDVIFDHQGEDDELLFITLIERRILLTRDTNLAKIAGSAVYLVRANSLWARVREVINHFGINPNIVLERCPVCNGEIEEVDKESAQDFVPPYTFQTHDRFWRCQKCSKFYWKGSHLELAEKDILTHLSNMDDSRESNED